MKNNSRQRRNERQEGAIERQEAYDALSTEEKLARQHGKARAKLEAQLEGAQS